MLRIALAILPVAIVLAVAPTGASAQIDPGMHVSQQPVVQTHNPWSELPINLGQFKQP
jgi:hypothetical protein